MKKLLLFSVFFCGTISFSSGARLYYPVIIDSIRYNLYADDMTASVAYGSDVPKCGGDIIIPDTVYFAGDPLDKRYSGGFPAGYFPVVSVGDMAFKEFTRLTSITLPEGVRVLGSSAFSGCIALKTVIFPLSLDTLGGFAFNGCSALTEIKLPENLQVAYNYVFNNCPNLKRVIFPKKSWVYYSGTFGGTTKIERVDYDWDYSEYSKYHLSTIRGYLEYNSKYELWSNGVKVDSVSITEIEGLGTRPLAGCTSLRTVRLLSRQNQSSPYNHWWGDCPNLNNIYVDKHFLQFGTVTIFDSQPIKNVFYEGGLNDWINEDYHYLGLPIDTLVNFYLDGITLKEVVLPNDIDSIKDWTFSNWKDLKKVVLHDSVKYIGYSAFMSTMLDSIICYCEQVPECPDGGACSIYDYANTIVEVPYGTTAAYRENYMWNNFTHIVERDPIPGALDNVIVNETSNMYDLQGRIVDEQYHGVAIQKGKKILK